MSAPAYKEYQMIMTVSPSLEEILVDWLLDYDSEHDFISFPVNSHSGKQQGLSLAEQVTGRQTRMRFQIALQSDELTPFLNRLKQDFQGTGLYYRVVPIVEGGHL